MKAPLSWLKEYVDITCAPEELQSKLFSCGFEVEEMIYVAKNIDKIVTCKILEIEKHPNADKLSLTKIDAGEFGILQIITSAKNIAVGDVVPVALDGATLNNGERIFKGELRGVPSDGMFCSGEELGINDDWYKGASVNGILILDKDFPLGVEVKKLLELEDVIFDINVTANRPDCQSILGIAREVSAVLDKPLKMPDLSYKTCENISTINTVKVQNNAREICPRYKAHLVKDIIIGESPLFIKRRLFKMGIRSISNIVDVTNYVLMEIGQPMHAFDLNDLEGNEINVRRANNDEKIVTLDEKEFVLSQNDLVIADKVKPVALAGIMGGLNSEIKETTKDVLLESAKFARDNVRKTSRKLGQRSDSSSRFEKGVDLYSVDIGLKRALNLIDTLKIGKIACDEYDLCFENLTEKVINTTVSRVNSVLGIDVPKTDIENILKRLNFGVNLDGDNLSITVPLYREDMEGYQDVAEEVIREYGYDKIIPTLLKTSAITQGGRNFEQNKSESLKNLLVGYGFNEMLSYSFVSEKELDTFEVAQDSDLRKFVKILNPLGEDLAVMRTTLLPSVIRAVARNLNRKNHDGRLFELAKIYKPKTLPVKELPDEKEVLCLSVFGNDEDFFTLKGVVEGIFDNFNFNANVEYLPCELKRMHPTRSANIYINGDYAGYLGQLNPIVGNKLDIDKPVYCAEFFTEILYKHLNSKIVFNSISKFPQVDRDLAISVNLDVPCADIMNVIKNSAGELLSDLKLFDVYVGEQIEKGKKSMAFSLSFVSKERTLNVEEIDEIIKKILLALREGLGAELR